MKYINESESSHKKMKSIFFIIFLLALVIGAIFATLKSTSKSHWIFDGDETLLKDIEIGYKISGGIEKTNWEITDSTNGQHKVKHYHGANNLPALLEKNYAQNRVLITAYSHDCMSSFSYVYNGISNSNINTEASKAFFSYYLQQAQESIDNVFEPVQLNLFMDTLRVNICLGDANNKNTDLLNIPIPDEVTVVPYVKWFLRNADKVDEKVVLSYLSSYSHDYRISSGNIGQNCYVVVAYRSVETSSKENDYTEIYLVSEDCKEYLPEAKLIKRFNYYMNIESMGVIDNQPFYYILSENSEIRFIDHTTFETTKTYKINWYDLLDREESEAPTSAFYVWQDLIHLKDNKLYILKQKEHGIPDLHTTLDVTVYEENNSKPLAVATLTNDLFHTEDLFEGYFMNAYYPDKDYYYLYDINFVVR